MTKKQINKTLKLWLAITFGALIGAIIVFVVYGQVTGGVETVRATIRYTGRVSFLFFLVPMIARPLHDLWRTKSTAFLLKYRNLFGLAFAGNHIWHLVFIIVLYQISMEAPEPLWILIGGSFGMLYLLLMTILSFPIPIKLAGATLTQWVHFLGFYYLVSAFFYDIIIRNWTTPNWFFWGLLIIALSLRFYNGIRLSLIKN